MVTWSARHAGDSAQLSEYFSAGTSPSEDAANYAALSFVGALISDVPEETPYRVTIGTVCYTVTVEEARNSIVMALACVLDVFETMEALRQLRAAVES